jgi:hypothetical protein
MRYVEDRGFASLVGRPRWRWFPVGPSPRPPLFMGSGTVSDDALPRLGCIGGDCCYACLAYQDLNGKPLYPRLL